MVKYNDTPTLTTVCQIRISVVGAERNVVTSVWILCCSCVFPAVLTKLCSVPLSETAALYPTLVGLDTTCVLVEAGSIPGAATTEVPDTALQRSGK